MFYLLYARPFNGREGSPVQFKDMASAAQSAADSAQQAVSAARAAAYLANQNSSEQKNSAGSRRQSLNSAAQAAADSAEEAVSAAQAAAYLANLNSNEQNNSAGSRRQSLNSTQSSATKNPSVNQSNHPSKISSSQSFNTSNYMNDEDNMDSVDLDDTKVIRRNGYADRSRVHSEMKFDDSDGLDSGDEPLVLPRIDQSESKPANSSMAARVHPKLPDYESLAAGFEALKSNRS